MGLIFLGDYRENSILPFLQNYIIVYESVKPMKRQRYVPMLVKRVICACNPLFGSHLLIFAALFSPRGIKGDISKMVINVDIT